MAFRSETRRLDDEYKDLRQSLNEAVDGTPQSELPVSDRGLCLTISKNTCFKDDGHEKMPFWMSGECTSIVTSFLIHRELGGVVLVDNDRLDTVPYPDAAIFARAILKPSEGYRVFEDFHGILHPGIEEIELQIIRNRLALYNQMHKPPRNALTGLSLSTFKDWRTRIEETIRGGVDGFFGEELADGPAILEGKPYNEIYDDPELLALHGRHFLEHEQEGVAMAIWLLSMHNKTKIGEIFPVID